jgi:hypothetical protein
MNRTGVNREEKSYHTGSVMKPVKWVIDGWYFIKNKFVADTRNLRDCVYILNTLHISCSGERCHQSHTAMTVIL